MKKLKRKLEKEKNEKIYDKEEVERLKYAVFEEFGTIEKEHYLIKQGFSRSFHLSVKDVMGLKYYSINIFLNLIRLVNVMYPPIVLR
jgi:hypothetical protein